MKKEYSVRIENTAYPVIFSDEREALLEAKAAGRAVLGLWDRDNPDRIPADIPYLVEEEAQITGEFLERLVRRHLKLPWKIAETKRLWIRELASGDWEFLKESCLAWGQNKESLPSLFTNAEAFLTYIRYQYSFYEYGIWALEEKVQHRLVGGCGFWDGENGETEIGYWISPAFQRKGYAEEAVSAVLDYAVELGKVPIYAEIREENIPSRRLAEKLQFTLPPEQSGARKLRYQYVP